ncbi:hypothetical protein L1887_36376 [Cichorium endivia]|nr:hypothetical protein L1887_36376 [Cichorium endivia]
MGSGNIWLDENLEAKISEFHLSLLVDQNKPQVQTRVAGAAFYIDPIYEESGVFNAKADVYSFGVILFEMLSGIMAYVERVIGDDTQPQRLINSVRRYTHDKRVDKLVDPSIKDQIDSRSLHVFKKIAYKCITWNLKDRPMMNTIIKRIQEALDFQIQAQASKVISQSYQPQNQNIRRIPLEEIISATENFSEKTCIANGGFSKVYKGRWDSRLVSIKRMKADSYEGEDEFHKELERISSFHHQNIISLVGYCDEANEKIVVYDYESNGSLEHHLQDPDKGSCRTWAQRLKICLGVARGLEYLHSELGVDSTVIHRDINSANILLDDNLEPKIYNFGLSLVVNRYQPQVYDLPTGTSFYRDPIYGESGIVNTELDVYAFGVVMLEMLSGRMASKTSGNPDDQPQRLTNLIRRYCSDHEGADMLIDPHISDQINNNSIDVFAKIACRCISYDIKDRPSMKTIVTGIEEELKIQERRHMEQGATLQHQDLESFRIPLKDIIYIPDKEHPIGDGGFGKVYKGQIISKGFPDCKVAIKCLDPEGLQGPEEFRTEVGLISIFQHPNIIPFVGYCDEGDQMIVVSEYAAKGSLDHHLSNPIRMKRITWAQRLNICLGAAKGLNYLHSGLTKYKVIHRDVKSGNILLDENLEAKLCDFGLSKQGLKVQKSQFHTKVAGTDFYLDPVYYETNILTKESDVYSFGVVLFEILRGRLAYDPIRTVNGEKKFLVQFVRSYYYSEPNKLIDTNIRNEIDNQCFETFKKVAFQCINTKSAERPKMDTIINQLQDAINFQVSSFTSLF